MRKDGAAQSDGQHFVVALNPKAPYFSRLSAQSALYTDFRILLDAASQPLKSIGFRELVLDRNVLSKPSTSSRKKAWKELKPRYLLDSEHPLFAAFWAEWVRCESEAEKAQTAYCLLALNDRLVTDLGSELLFPLLRRAPQPFRVQDVLAFINRAQAVHPEITSWTVNTKEAVAKKYTASIRDFGLAKGTVNKTTVRPALYGAPVRLLIRALRIAGRKDLEIVQEPVFRLLALESNEVIGALSELNRQNALRFRMQGDVVELEIGGRS
ncbi:MAG: BrxA family protein [Desulfomonilaceae bacterium]